MAGTMPTYETWGAGVHQGVPHGVHAAAATTPGAPPAGDGGPERRAVEVPARGPGGSDVVSVRPGAGTPPPPPVTDGREGDTPSSVEVSPEDQELITAWGLVLEAVAFTNQGLFDGLERAGVSAPFFDVLVRLAREPSQRLPMTKLATEVSLTSGGFTKLADRMEQEGLLYRQHSAQDRRVIYAVLTDAGRAAAADIFPSHVADLRHHLEDVLGRDGVRQLASLCRALRDANGR